MLVVAIIILLLGSAVYMMKPQLGIAKNVRAQNDLRTFQTALLSYEANNSFLPSNEQGLAALVSEPSGEPHPRHWAQGMEKLPVDPWGMPFLYENPGKHNPKSYDVYSAGPDRIPGTADDIGNWDN